MTIVVPHALPMPTPTVWPRDMLGLDGGGEFDASGRGLGIDVREVGDNELEVG